MLADLVLIVHFCYVLFVVGGLPLIWFGAWRNWSFVTSSWFRYSHLAAILFVVAESLFGVVCPLTAWENALRHVQNDSSFIQRWLHQIMFYNVSEHILTAIYILFAVLVALTFKWVPVNSRRNQILLSRND